MLRGVLLNRLHGGLTTNQLLTRIAAAYYLIAAWAFGWLAATFGMMPSLFAALIIFAPAFFAWRMAKAQRSTTPRECAYLAVVTTAAVVATAFLVTHWFGAGMDSLARFDREFRAFRRHVASTPEYKHVQLSYTHRKGGRVYMHGSVPSQYWHERLIHDIESMVRSNFSGYFDGVTIRSSQSERTFNPSP
jgi:hypothetical protein